MAVHALLMLQAVPHWFAELYAACVANAEIQIRAKTPSSVAMT